MMTDSENTFWLFEDTPTRAALSALGFFAVDLVRGLSFSSSVMASWGYTAVATKEIKFIDLVADDNDPAIFTGIADLWSGKLDSFSGTFKIRRADGTPVWAKVDYQVLSRQPDGSPHIMIGHDQDVDAIMQAELESRQRLVEIETIRRVSNDLSTSLDLDETVNSILEHTKRVIPYDKATVQLLQGDWLKVIGCYGFKDRESTLKLRFKYPVPGSLSTVALQSRKPVVCADVEKDFPDFYQAPDAKPICSWLGIPLIANNEVLGLMALDSVSRDFYTIRQQEIAEMMANHVAMAIEQACLYKNMQEMAKTDSLTGIGNRHSLRIHGPLMFEAARRDRKPLTLLMADLDHFKNLNDTYGHDAGDVVLAETSVSMASKLRPEDLFIRYGGEEFLVILADADDKTGIEVAERIRCSVQDRAFTGIPNGITVSVGVHSAVPDLHDTLSGFIKEVDKALYQAKEQGRNRVVRSCS